jgi:hypothetical protein
MMHSNFRPTGSRSNIKDILWIWSYWCEMQKTFREQHGNVVFHVLPLHLTLRGVSS